jgi:precorrin-6B methylase 2
LFFLISLSFLFLLTPLFSLIPFVPVRKKILNEIISALELNEQSVLYDLGCGDGRVLFTALKVNPNIVCVGIEISPFPFLLAKMKEFFCVSKDIDISYGDFFKVDVSPASHIFLYLFPRVLDALLPKLEKELQIGSRVVSCDFYFSKRKPDKILEIKATKWQKNKRLYIYDF